MTTARIEHVLAEGFPFIRLFCENGVSQTEALVSPLLGANFTRLTYNGHRVCDFEPEIFRRRGFTGSFLLYPHPNRMSGDRYLYNGVVRSHPFDSRYNAFLHAGVRSEVFSVEEMSADGDHAVLRCSLPIQPGMPVYDLYPFPHRFEITYTLTPGSLRMDFTIDNRGGTEPVPYGLAIHPYFMRLSGDEGTGIEVPMNSSMEATAELLPTGRLLPVEGITDLRTPRRLCELSGTDESLDHVFTDRIPGRRSVIRYEGLPFRTELDASPEFTHAVVYAPPGKPYFCIENQTCSTDMFNMHARGFTRQAHMLTCAPGAADTHWITIELADAAVG